MKKVILLFALLFLFFGAFAQSLDSNVILKNLDYPALQAFIKRDKLVLIHFKADWCVVCKREKPILESIQAENKAILIVQELDLDDNPLIGQYYEIDALPVHMLFKEGLMIWNKVGMIDKKEFEGVLKVVSKK